MKLPSTRREPYTERGIARVRCVQCGRRTAVCSDCDREINRIVATWAFGRVRAAALLRRYIGAGRMFTMRECTIISDNGWSGDMWVRAEPGVEGHVEQCKLFHMGDRGTGPKTGFYFE